MKRLFHQTKIYDYSSMKECEKHIEQMEKNGWKAKLQYTQDGCDYYIYNNGQDELPYSVEYMKGV